MLLYICWQKCQIYIVPAKLRKYKYIYNIVKETVTLNIKLTEESIYTISDPFKVARNSFHFAQTSFTNSFPITVWFIVSV